MPRAGICGSLAARAVPAPRGATVNGGLSPDLVTAIPCPAPRAVEGAGCEVVVQRERALIEALGVAVYTVDAEGRLTFYNTAAAELWGWSPPLADQRWCGSWRLFSAGRHAAAARPVRRWWHACAKAGRSAATGPMPSGRTARGWPVAVLPDPVARCRRAVGRRGERPGRHLRPACRRGGAGTSARRASAPRRKPRRRASGRPAGARRGRWGDRISPSTTPIPRRRGSSPIGRMSHAGRLDARAAARRPAPRRADRGLCRRAGDRRAAAARSQLFAVRQRHALGAQRDHAPGRQHRHRLRGYHRAARRPRRASGTWRCTTR